MTAIDAIVACYLFAGALPQLRWSDTRLTSYADRMIGCAAFLVLGPRVAWLSLVAGGLACAAFAAAPHLFGRFEAQARAKVAAAGVVDTVAAVVVTHLVVRALHRSYPVPVAPFSSLSVQIGFWLPAFTFLFTSILMDALLVRFVLRAPDDPRLERLEPFRWSLFTVAVASMPLVFASRIVYQPAVLFPFCFALAWVFALNVSFARTVGRRRRLGVVLDELSTKERLAAVGEVSARVVHHTRHQLAIIGITVHRIEKRIASLPPDEQEVVRAELEKLGDVQRELSDMLSNALRATNGLPGARLARSSYADLVTGVARRLDALAVSRGVRLILENLAPAERAVPSHPDNVSDAIFNVVENALVATRSAVTISAKTRGDRLIVVVRDDGDGMPSEVIARAKKGVITTKVDGTGIGLVLARAAVEGEKGALNICNRDEGGCEVELAVPFRQR